MLVAIAREAHTDLVLRVERKGVVNGQAAARAYRKVVEMLFLRQVRRKRDRVAARRAGRAAEREAADFAGRRDVALQQRRREITDRHVVETVAGFVTGQQRGDVGVDRQQVADRVV